MSQKEIGASAARPAPEAMPLERRRNPVHPMLRQRHCHEACRLSGCRGRDDERPRPLSDSRNRSMRPAGDRQGRDRRAGTRRTTAPTRPASHVVWHALRLAILASLVRSERRISEQPRRSIRSTGTDLRNQRTEPRRWSRDAIEASDAHTHSRCCDGGL